jgi:hypothetical protein
MIHSTPLFDNDGRPTAALSELLTLFEVEHDGTLSGIRDATQAAWYQAGKLRAEITEKHGHKKEAALPLFEQLGFMGAVKASHENYLHALVLGATVVAVRKRLAFLVSEWERGVRFSTLSLLGSERPLMADKESANVLLDPNNADLPFDASVAAPNILPTNEGEMMAMVYAQATSRFPWGDLPMQLVVAPKIEGRNANTADTLLEWNKLSLMGGRCLVISSQPFVTYQGVIARKNLSRRHDVVDCAGYASAILPVTTYLDNVAKIIHELAS